MTFGSGSITLYETVYKGTCYEEFWNYFLSNISSYLSDNFEYFWGAIDTADFDRVEVGAVDANDASEPRSESLSSWCFLVYFTAGEWEGLV